MLGVIKIHDTERKKFGFLVDVQSGERLFFSRHDIEAEASLLLPGTPVVFELKTYRDNRTHEPRRKATKVTPADPQAVLDALKPGHHPDAVARFALPPRAKAFAEVSDAVVGQQLSGQ